MTSAIELPTRTKHVILLGTMLGLMVAASNQTVLSTALPRIVTDLGGLALLSWVFTGYMLTSTIIVPIAGKLSDLYGRKPFFLAGVALFMIASHRGWRRPEHGATDRRARRSGPRWRHAHLELVGDHRRHVRA